MSYKKMTAYFIIAMVLSIVVWDIYVMSGGGTEASISHVIIEWSYKYPVFTFAIGFTFGHLMWRVRQTEALNKIETTKTEGQ